MMHKSKLLLMLAMLSVSILAFGQSIYELDAPIATSDNLFAPVTNPALIGTGNPGGIGWAHLYDSKEFQDRYWFIANLKGLSYVYENNNNVSYHDFSIGSEMFEPHIFRNLYVGSSYRWKNSNTSEGDYKSGIVYRPHDSSSIAMVLENAYKSAPAYKFGLGIRPMAILESIADYRAEVTIDLPYLKNQDREYAFNKPILGISTQLVDGIKIGGSYNLESETSMLNFSISQNKTEMGSIGRLKKDDNWGIAYAHFTNDSFKPFLGLSPKTWYKMNLKGQLVTYKSPKYTVGPFSLFDAKTKSIESVIAELQKAKDDPAIHGILLQNPSFGASFSVMQELLTAIEDYKKSGKPLAVYYDNITNGAYIFAAAVADKIYLNKNGMVDLRGFSVNSPYFKELLEYLGVEAMNFRSHDYKTAGNMFSESEMTAAERKVYEELLGSIYSQALQKIDAGRGDKFKGKTASQIIDNGPYWIPDEALEAGLVDALIYQDQLMASLNADFGFKKTSSEQKQYADYDWSKPKENQIAVIYAQGNIVMGKGTPGQKIAHDTTVEKIRAARKNKSYKGIILRIDSGGGSAQASDIIWRELELAKTENKKPIVVSMSGAAASGGYYIACNADKIVANPGTITGSIGVIGLAFNAEQMFKKIKVNWSTVNFGKRADMGSLNRAWKEDEKELMLNMIKHSYADFTGKVALGRNMPIERIQELAQGRVWTGEQAFENGLVDVLGGLDEAARQMRELTGIKGKMVLVDATTSSKGIAIQMQSDPLSFIMPQILQNDLSSEMKKVYELWSDYSNDRILMLSPLSGDDIK